MYQLGLIGYPIEHSLSPWIHQQFFNIANVTGTYSLYEINPKTTSFNSELDILKKKLHGFNVTIPYKEIIIPSLDELHFTAKVAGAVNTVVLESGKWIGYNTDGIGYIKSLKKQYPHLFENQQIKTLIIGAGGAARGIYHALITSNFKYIDMTNRTLDHAQEIVKQRKDDVVSNLFPLEDVQGVIQKYDLIIQTTSIGMTPKEHETIIPFRMLKAGAVVSDIIYQPIKTTFLQGAENIGAHIHQGHTMLLYQAERAFKIWTNKEVTLTDMDTDLKELLEGR